MSCCFPADKAVTTTVHWDPLVLDCKGRTGASGLSWPLPAMLTTFSRLCSDPACLLDRSGGEQTWTTNMAGKQLQARYPCSQQEVHLRAPSNLIPVRAHHFQDSAACCLLRHDMQCQLPDMQNLTSKSNCIVRFMPLAMAFQRRDSDEEHGQSAAASRHVITGPSLHERHRNCLPADDAEKPGPRKQLAIAARNGGFGPVDRQHA